MKLNALARKGLTDESAREIYEIMTDSDLSSLDILMHIQKIKDKTTDSKEKMMVSKLMLDWHKSHHGEKHKQEVQVFGSSSIHIKFDDPGKREEKVE